jgi:protein-glutamine gamma-glutamyltransferase
VSGAIARLRELPLARLGAFSALALFVAVRWAALLGDPPMVQILAATLALVGLGIVLAALGVLAARGRWRWPAAAGAALAGLAAAALILGVPARLLLPGNWDQLGSAVGSGLDLAAGASYPYPAGGDDWARLAIMLGLPLAVGAGAMIVFWPTAAAATARAIAGLAILVGAYGTAATLSPPDAPLLEGLGLFALVAAWLWLPLIARPNAAMGLGLVAVAGLAALPLCSGATGREPLLDYRHWDLSSGSAGGSEFFTWNHSYGPLGWPRRGQRLMVVGSSGPHYWRTAVLDRFDGVRWLEPLDRPPPALQLPSLVGKTASAAHLRPHWVHTARFRIDGLSSQLVVAAGTPLSVQGLGPINASDGGIVRTDGDGISEGDGYTVHYYSPQPTPAQMRRASSVRYRPAMRRYTTLAVPRRFPGTLEAQDGRQVPVEAVTEPVTVPLRSPRKGGTSGGETSQRRLLASPYGSVYRLARHLSANAATTYDAVASIHRQLLGAYSYNENPPLRRFPLRAFLFRDRKGYCQQFSGAMALMLRMIGVPSRVASGFSPGSPEGGPHRYVVHDFDAHSWVEVYFEGIGWVPFDPTPGTSPAASTSPGPTLPPVLRTRRPFSEIGASRSPAPGAPAESSGGGRDWLPFAAIVGFGTLLAILAWGLLALARTRRPLEGPQLAEAQVAELRRALAAMGRPIAAGFTLRRLERDSASLGRTGLADYASKLGAYRYGDRAAPPGPAERRRMRRELARRRGPWRTLRALRAVPPLGPRPARASDV